MRELIADKESEKIMIKAVATVAALALTVTAGSAFAATVRFTETPTDTQKRAEATDVLQSLLQTRASLGVLDNDPARIAQRLVLSVWEADPEVLDGRHYGQRPYKTTLAAVALASAIDALPSGSDTHAYLLHCLSQLVADLSETGRLLPLSHVDHELIARAQDVLVRQSRTAVSSALIT